MHFLIKGLMVGATFGLFGCSSVPAKRDIVRVESFSRTAKCIGVGKDSHDIISRCMLITWADIPIESDRPSEIGFSIDKSERYPFPCKKKEDDNPSITPILTGKILIKCRLDTARIYWIDRTDGLKQHDLVQFESPSFNIIVLLYQGDNTRRYVVHGQKNAPSVFIPQTLPASDEVIDDTLESLKSEE